MVLCATCRVNSIDRHCTNTPRSCYQCCTSHDDIITWPPHYHQMGVSDAAARLASGRVHPNVAEDAQAGLQDGEQSPSSEVAPHSVPPSNAGPPSSANAAPQPGNMQGASGSGSVPPAVAQSPSIDAQLSPIHPSVAALRAVMEADKAEAEVRLTALQAQLTAQATATERILALLQAQQSVAASPAQEAHLPSPARPSAAAPGPSPPPHRRAVLDNTVAPTASRAEVAELVNRFSALADEDSDDDAHEVTPQTHSHTRAKLAAKPPAILPAAFVPTPSGSEQSAQQQLAAIVNGLSRQGGKVKYSSVAELDEALEDWVADSIKAGWTLAQVESIRAYQRFLISGFAVSERRPLKEVLEYHRKWCKAVHAGTIDMFAHGAELNHTILYEVSHPRQYGGGHTSGSGTLKTSKLKESAAAAKAGATGGHPAAGKHPPGSCTNHPASTTHTTAECKKK